MRRAKIYKVRNAWVTQYWLCYVPIAHVATTRWVTAQWAAHIWVNAPWWLPEKNPHAVLYDTYPGDARLDERLAT